MKKSLLTISLLALAACNVGPKYKPPEITFSDGWGLEKLSPTSDSPQEIVTKWWDTFDDPLLSSYIEKGATSNFDLKAAESRILEARAIRQVTASQLFPQIIGDFNASKTYFSKNGPVFAGQSLTAGTSATTGLPFVIQIPQVQNLFNALLDASWELDLFGKTLKAVEAAEANIEKAIAHKNALVLTLCAEIARNYMDLRTSQKLGQLIEEDISLLEEELRIEQKQYFQGYHDKVSLEEREAELAKQKGILPQIHAQIYQSIYAISTLIGEPPESLLQELLPFSPLPLFPDHVALGLRSDLLRRRPDVREAERQIAAETAGVGIAVANFFPTITLGGDLGLQALKIANLFQHNSKTWSVGGDVNQPIFQGGQLVGNLKAARASAAAALYLYQQTVLSALQEAESALISFESNQKSYEYSKEVFSKTESILNITTAQANLGLIDTSRLIMSQRNTNQALQDEIKSQSKTLMSLISLYKSLGGGWEAFEEKK